MDFLMLNAHKIVPGGLPGSNLGMNILLQLANKRGYKTEMIQSNVAKITEQVNLLIKDNLLPPVVGFYTDFNNIKWTSKIILHIKHLSPKTVVIVGGPQSIGLDDTFLRQTGCDVLCPGEGEESLMEILDYFLRGQGSLKDIMGIGFLENDRYYSTPQRVAKKNLDDIPWPDLSLSPDYSKYFFPILTGRGCPMGCTFCYEGANARNIRTYSVGSVLNEIKKRLESDPTLKYINFLDDTFTLNPQRVEELCEGLKEFRKTYNFIWFCSGHIQTVRKNPGLIKKMTESGLSKMFFGLESGNDNILNSYNKHITGQMMIDTVQQCMDEGLKQIAGNFIIGGPHESRSTVEDSFKLIETLLKIAPGRFDTSFFTFLPYPNTPITKNPQSFGITIYDKYIDCCLEDIPLSSTENLNFDDICDLRILMNYTLQQKMRQMYKDGQVPEEAILDIYRMNQNYGVYSKWMDYVYSHNPVEDSYWKKRALFDYKPSKTCKDLSNALVVRTLNIWEDYNTINKTNCSVPITENEINCLALCNGKMTEHEIILENEKKGIPALETVKTIRSFEEKKWVLYAAV